MIERQQVRVHIMIELTTAGQPVRATRTEATASPRQVLLIVCAGVVLASLDLFIVNVALPQIARDLGAPNLGELSWVLNGYAIVYASLLVFFGRLADRYRRDRAFLLGVAIFTAASAACAASTSVGMLVGFRLVQAAGAALADADLARAAAGLVRTRASPWRRTGVDCCRRPGCRARAGGRRAARRRQLAAGVPGERSHRGRRLACRVAPAPSRSRARHRAPGCPGGRPRYWRHCRAHVWPRRGQPLGLDLGRHIGFAVRVSGARRVVRSALPEKPNPARAPIVVPLSPIHGGVASSHLLLGRVRSDAPVGGLMGPGPWGWSALRSGLALAPGPIMVPVIAFLAAGRLISRYGPALVIGLGSVMFAAGVAWWALAITSQPDYLAGVLGGIILTGVGVGLTLPTMMATASASLPPSSFATGSAVINMVRQTGLALGVAVLVAVARDQRERQLVAHRLPARLVVDCGHSPAWDYPCRRPATPENARHHLKFGLQRAPGHPGRPCLVGPKLWRELASHLHQRLGASGQEGILGLVVEKVRVAGEHGEHVTPDPVPGTGVDYPRDGLGQCLTVRGPLPVAEFGLSAAHVGYHWPRYCPWVVADCRSGLRPSDEHPLHRPAHQVADDGTDLGYRRRRQVAAVERPICGGRRHSATSSARLTVAVGWKTLSPPNGRTT